MPELDLTEERVLLDVVHDTGYRYASPVELSQHIAHLRPREDACCQRLLGFEMSVDPPPSHHASDVDGFGNHRAAFSLAYAHDHLLVRATSRVEVRPQPPLDASPPWELARERWRFRAGAAYDEAAAFRFASPQVGAAALADPELRAFALASFTPGRALHEAATELMHRVHAAIRYVPQSTTVGTPVQEVFAQRRGVCQDQAHLMIALLRSLGFAVRYVSGYLRTEPAGGEPRLVGADASHAWVALACPVSDGGADAVRWLELDATNDRLAGTDHVRVAWGRDFTDVTPLAGVIRGGGAHTLSVRVSTQEVPQAMHPIGTIPA